MNVSHPIPNDQIERLARLRGVYSLSDWEKELEQAEERIERLIDGDFEQAWERCFPIWLKQGRVRDLSRDMRTPKYWPSFARRLGSAFTDRFWESYAKLIDKLNESDPGSYDELIVYDLLDSTAGAYTHPDIGQIPPELLSINRPLPAVIRVELGLPPDKKISIGEMLRTAEY